MAENITCLQSDPSQDPSPSSIRNQNTPRQNHTWRQGVSKKGKKKVRTRTTNNRQVTVLVENKVLKGKKNKPGIVKRNRPGIAKKNKQGIAMSGWSSGYQSHLPDISCAPHNSYSALNQNLGRSSHNFQERAASSYEPNFRNNKGRQPSVFQNYGAMGQNTSIVDLGSQGYSGLKIDGSIPSSAMSEDMNWRVDRPGTSDNPMLVVDYGHVRCNPQPDVPGQWGSATNRDRSQSNRPPPMSNENMNFINNIAITDDIMSSLKKTVHLMTEGSKNLAGLHQNAMLPSYDPPGTKRTGMQISDLFQESCLDHHKHLDPYSNASNFQRLEQMRVTQKKPDRNKAFNYLREWRQKINLPTDTLMLEREELFPADHGRSDVASGLVDISPTSMSGFHQQEGRSSPRPVTSQDLRTNLYMTDEKQRWKQFMKPVTSSLSSISDAEEFGLDERRSKESSFRKNKFSEDPGCSKSPGLRYNYGQKGYGRSHAPHTTMPERYGQSQSYRSRSRSPKYAASPSRLSRRSRSPRRKSRWEKSVDNSRRTVSPISSTRRTSQEDYQSRHSPFMSPGRHLSNDYQSHRQADPLLQNLFDRPEQLPGRMYSRSPSPRTRRTGLRKSSPYSGGTRSPIYRNLRPHGLSPGSLRTNSRSQSPTSRRPLRYSALSSRSLSPRDRRRLTSRSVSPRNRRLHARSRSPRSLSSRDRRLTSRSISPRNRGLNARSRSPRSRRDMTRTRSPRNARITSRSPSRNRGSLSPRNDRRTPLWHLSPRNRRVSGSRSLSPRNDRTLPPWHHSPRNRELSRSHSPRYRKSQSPRNRRYPSRSPSPGYRRLSLRSLSPANRGILSRTPSPRDRSSRSPGLRNERRDFDLPLASRLDSPEPRTLSGRQSPSGRNVGTSLHRNRIFFDKDVDKSSLYGDGLGDVSSRRRLWSEEGGSSKRTVSVSEERNGKNLDDFLKQIRSTHEDDGIHLRAGRESPEDLRHSIIGRKSAKVTTTSEHEEANEDLRLQLLRIKERKISKRIEMLDKQSLKTETQLIEIENKLENSQSSFDDDLPQDYKLSSESPQYSRSKRSESPAFVESFDLREEEILDAKLSPEGRRRVRSRGLEKTVQHSDRRGMRSRKKSEGNKADLDFVQGGRMEGNKSSPASYRLGQEKKKRERDPEGRNFVGEKKYFKGKRKY